MTQSGKGLSQEEMDYGKVTAINPDGSAQVTLPRRAGCQPDMWSKYICDQFDDHTLTLRALNPIQAQKGAKVEVQFVTPALGKSMLVMYILPILALILGAILGSMANLFGDQNLSAVIGAVVLLIISLAVVFGINRGRSKRPEGILPKITRIVE